MVKRKALIVGINDYPNAPLTACIRDATDLAKLMIENEDGSLNFEVDLVTDITRKSQLKSKIIDLFSQESEVALLYFSGHGLENDLGGYIVTPDYVKFDEGISMDEILTICNISKAQHKIIILDCCHSGAMGSPAIHGGTSASISEGMTVLTASKRDELSKEINGTSVFTNLLISALTGGAADLIGHITPGSVYSYIDKALGPFEQRPVFKSNVSKFTLLRKVEPPVSIKTLHSLTQYFKPPDFKYRLDKTYDNDFEVATPEHTSIMTQLRELHRVGLVVPEGVPYMYDAAEQEKEVTLTSLGHHYWRLVDKDRI